MALTIFTSKRKPAEYSANYKAGYNAGVSAADGRSNPNSTNYKAGYNAGVSSGRSGTKIRLHLKGWENMKSSKGEWSQNGGPDKSDYNTYDKNYGDTGMVRSLGAGYGAADCWIEWLN